MKPIVPSPRIRANSEGQDSLRSQDQDLHPGGNQSRVLKYGKNKVVETYFKIAEVEQLTFQQPAEEEKQPESQTLMINFGKISQDLLILQNQIKEAATSLRESDPQNPDKKLPLTQEAIERNPHKL